MKLANSAPENQISADVLGSLLRMMPEGLLVLDSDNCINYTNEAALKIFEVSNETEFLGKHFSMLYSDPNEADNFMAILCEYTCLVRWENTFVTSRGKTFIGSYSGSMVQGISGKKVMLLQDVSSTLQLSSDLIHSREYSKKIAKELDQFIYTVSHDLKAPLRAISNLSSWIQEDMNGSVTHDSQKNFQMLRNRVTRMESMINGLSEFAKAVKLPATGERVDISQLLPEILNKFYLPPQTLIEIAEMPIITAPKGALDKIFFNLIDNAIRFNTKGTKSIRINSTDRGDHVEFTVEDNGPGILPDHFEKIFMIFQTLQPKDVLESTGIGLTLTKRLVEDCGGSIWVESEPGLGSTFIFRIPKYK